MVNCNYSRAMPVLQCVYENTRRKPFKRVLVLSLSRLVRSLAVPDTSYAYLYIVHSKHMHGIYNLQCVRTLNSCTVVSIPMTVVVAIPVGSPGLHLMGRRSGTVVWYRSANCAATDRMAGRSSVAQRNIVGGFG